MSKCYFFKKNCTFCTEILITFGTCNIPGCIICIRIVHTRIAQKTYELIIYYTMVQYSTTVRTCMYESYMYAKKAIKSLKNIFRLLVPDS